MKVAIPTDVSAVVKFVNENRAPFLGISGVHGWTTSLEKFNNGFGIDLH